MFIVSIPISKIIGRKVQDLISVSVNTMVLKLSKSVKKEIKPYINDKKLMYPINIENSELTKVIIGCD